MTASDVEQLFGAEKFRVNYVVNGQPASRVVFETREKTDRQRHLRGRCRDRVQGLRPVA
jgi:hypothetical protein